jgi:TrmH family RNA methyltransferase
MVCEGTKLLREALQRGIAVSTVVAEEETTWNEPLPCERLLLVPPELLAYVSTQQNPDGLLFTCALPRLSAAEGGRILLENVQDPGNVGTILRTANAFAIDAVILTGDCADPYHPKTVRATMGAIFRQQILRLDLPALKGFLADQGLPLYGAALDPAARDVRHVKLQNAAVAIGSEGKGLSEELLGLCRETLLIPMQPDSESLNAAVAAAIVMWEMSR